MTVIVLRSRAVCALDYVSQFFCSLNRLCLSLLYYVRNDLWRKFFLSVITEDLYKLVFSIIMFMWSIMRYNDINEEKEKKEKYLSELSEDVDKLEYLVNAPANQGVAEIMEGALIFCKICRGKPVAYHHIRIAL